MKIRIANPFSKFKCVVAEMVAININKLCDFAKLGDCFSVKRIEGGKSFRLGVQHKCLKSWYDLKKGRRIYRMCKS